MNFDCNELYKVIVDTQNINYNPLKEIKVTNEFYEQYTKRSSEIYSTFVHVVGLERLSSSGRWGYITEKLT